jgi:hypothetical protein
MKIVFNACHRDIEQTAFLFQLLSGAGTEIGGHAAVDNIKDEDRFPLLALRRMDRGQDYTTSITA